MNVHVCEKTPWLDCLMTTLRNTNTGRGPFRKAANLIGEYLVIQAINCGYIPTKKWSVETPTGSVVDGCSINKPSRILAVPIVRAGTVFIESLLRVVSMDIQVGHLVIQRDEKTALPITLLEKLPKGTSSGEFDLVIVLDPMLATGGSVLAAIDILLAKGVDVEKIVVLHAIGCPEGIKALTDRHPNIKAVVGVVDTHLNEESKQIIPGLGDFGDRYFS